MHIYIGSNYVDWCTACGVERPATTVRKTEKTIGKKKIVRKSTTSPTGRDATPIGRSILIKCGNHCVSFGFNRFGFFLFGERSKVVISYVDLTSMVHMQPYNAYMQPVTHP
jgi:hypothetical protein